MIWRKETEKDWWRGKRQTRKGVRVCIPPICEELLVNWHPIPACPVAPCLSPRPDTQSGNIRPFLYLTKGVEGAYTSIIPHKWERSYPEHLGTRQRGVLRAGSAQEQTKLHHRIHCNRAGDEAVTAGAITKAAVRGLLLLPSPPTEGLPHYCLIPLTECQLKQHRSHQAFNFPLLPAGLARIVASHAEAGEKRHPTVAGLGNMCLPGADSATTLLFIFSR